MKILKKISEIFRKIVIGYVFYTFILTLIAFFILPGQKNPGSEEAMDYWLHNVIANNTLYIAALAQIMIWNLTSLLFSVSMFFSRNNREIFIKKLSGIKERDEREVQIVGKALRASYLTTMTILLFLLFMSLFSIEASKKSAHNIKPGEPHGTGVTISFDYNPLNPDTIITQKKGYVSFFKYNGSALPTPTVILILFVWQIVSFRVVSRRALKVPN